MTYSLHVLMHDLKKIPTPNLLGLELRPYKDAYKNWAFLNYEEDIIIHWCNGGRLLGHVGFL